MSTEIAALEQDRYDAMRRHDIIRLRELLADEAIYTHSNAESDDKLSYLRKVENGTYFYHAITVTDQAIAIIGDTALVRARMTADVAIAGRRKSIDNRALAVWVRRASGWQLAAYQPTVIPLS